MSISKDYPWTVAPLVSCAPMRLITLAPLAAEVSLAGGLGFIGAGNDLDDLNTQLELSARIIRDRLVGRLTQADRSASCSLDVTGQKDDQCQYDGLGVMQSFVQSNPLGSKGSVLPVGIGVLNWGADIEKALAAVSKHRPAAFWMFGARMNSDYIEWCHRVREASDNQTKIWIQIGTVLDAVEVVRDCKPDVLVVQGSDAGGHGLEAGASLVTLLPEVDDALNRAGLNDLHLIAAGGIMDGRGAAASLTLGAHGVCLGTRFLASEEATITSGYRDAVIRAYDGGVTTVRTKVYDQLRGTTDWPLRYNARGIINQSLLDHKDGMDVEENKRLYGEAVKQGDSGWGIDGRLATYAGTGVGLVDTVMKAGEIVRQVQLQTRQRLYSASHSEWTSES